MGGRLEGKVALVFGAGSVGPGWGNGKATTVAFAREGAKVISIDLNAEAAQETANIVLEDGGICEAMAADVTQSAQVKRVVDHCLSVYGRIDILQNNVGMAYLGGPVEMSEQTWTDSLQLNVGSMFLTTKYVLPIMERQQSGAIVNISSIASIRWLGTAYIAYASSKAAVNQFTQAIALQYAGKGIRANVIMPGLMNTPNARASLLSTYSNEKELVERRNAACPMGAMGDAWDIAYASVFLASDEAKYVTGVVLPVDGGLTCRAM
jgi:NAD(P)-dependent dehydrogenase (short-subunit alcohol dehydrogenase family)